LFLLVDDYSRLLVHGRWVTEENTRAGQDVLRSAISRRGRPEILYVDNADTWVMPTPESRPWPGWVESVKLSA
jgi:transposase InsO family protein